MRFAQLLAAVTPLTAVEQVSTFDADGRVLAADVVSELQVPAFDNSAMDGYAVRAEDLMVGSNELRVTQRIAAGATVGEHLQAGTACTHFHRRTGTPRCRCGGHARRLHPHPDEPAHGFRPRLSASTPRPCRASTSAMQGEDVQRGDCVLPAGTRAGPGRAGLGCQHRHGAAESGAQAAGRLVFYRRRAGHARHGGSTRHAAGRHLQLQPLFPAEPAAPHGL